MLSQSHEANEKYKEEIKELKAKIDYANVKLKKNDDRVRDLHARLISVQEENSNLKLDIEKTNLENLGLKNDMSASKRELEMKDTNNIINEKNEEIERNMNKIKETRKKEIHEIQRERICAQEDLYSSEKENNNIKDKENTITISQLTQVLQRMQTQ